MTKKLKNIFNLLTEFADCSHGFIFSKEENMINLRASFGPDDLDSNFVLSFYEDLLNVKNVKPEELKSFEEIRSKYSIQSVYVGEVPGLAAESFKIILFSKTKSLHEKIYISKIEKIITIIPELLIDENPLYLLEDNPLFANIDVALLVTNSIGKILFANKKFFEILELDYEAHKNFDWNSIEFFDVFDQKIPPENLPFNIALEQDTNVVEQKIKYKLPDKIKWLKINAIAMRDSANQIRSIVNSFWDISETMEIEKNLRETTQNIESVLYSIDADKTNFNFISESVEKVFGYTVREIYGKRIKFLRRILPDDLKIFRNFRDKVFGGVEAVVEYRIKDKANHTVYVRHSGVPILKDGKVIRIVGIISNITEQKRILNELEKSEERFRILIDTAEDIIFTLKANGYFTLINKNGAHALGNTQEDMIGKDFFDFIDDSCKAEVSQAFIDILSSDKPRSFDAVFLDNLDEPVIFEIQARATKLNGEGVGILGIGRNMNEQRKNEVKLKELNEKLTEANKIISVERDKAKHQIDVLEELNRLKNEFISNVSHELRTPLASIVGFAETISSDKDLPLEMVLEFNNIILNEGKRLAKLINDVLDFSRLESGKEGLNKSHFVLRNVLQDVLSAFTKQSIEKRIKLEAFLPAEEVILFADKERIIKAITHLLSNAFKFTNSGGSVTMRTFDYPTEVEIRIADTGIGIDEKDIPNLFQKFSKVTRPGSQVPGMGFGLVSVKQIIDAHKGHIGVASTLNKGTTFRVRIPKTN